KGCPDAEGSCPTRHLGPEGAERRAVGVVAAEVGSRGGEGAPVCLGVTDEGCRAVIWDVQPLVAVDRDGMCTLDAGDELERRRRGRCEEAERTVDVQPRSVL